MPAVGVVVLAGGRSSRFSGSGAHKLIAPINGVPVVRRSVTAAVRAEVGRVTVVTGANAHEVSAALEGLDIDIVHAAGFADGMSASLKRGVEALTMTDAIVVTLGDQPGLRPEAIRRVMSCWRESGSKIVVPRYVSDDRPAHPVLFASAVYSELLTLQGDAGARSVIARDPGRVAVATLDWPAPRDIDTIDDLKLAAAELAAVCQSPHPSDPGGAST